MNPEVIGFIAGAATCMASLPQAIKLIRTRKTRDLSLPTYAVLTAGLLLWVVYGIQKDSLSIILSNGLALLPNGTILIMLAYQRISGE